MIKEYRKKTTIKAEQFTGSLRQIDTYKVHIVGAVESLGDTSYFTLPTKEGNMVLHEGDWIATGIDGEHWAIADDVFRRTYEEADDNDC